jgi:hypothetical protein
VKFDSALNAGSGLEAGIIAIARLRAERVHGPASPLTERTTNSISNCSLDAYASAGEAQFRQNFLSITYCYQRGKSGAAAGAVAGTVVWKYPKLRLLNGWFQLSLDPVY